MNEQSFEFKATAEGSADKMAPFEAAFPAALARRLSGARDLGRATCEVAGPRKGDALQLAVAISAGDERIEGSVSIEFSRHATATVCRGEFTWHATREVGQGSRLVSTMEKPSFVKIFQKHVAAAVQDALLATGCATAGATGTCPPGQKPAAHPVSCPRCGYSIAPGTAKQGRCPFCKVKL